MTSRANILAALRANRPAGEHPLPDVPDFSAAAPKRDTGGDGLLPAFCDAFTRMGGTVLDGCPPLDGVRALLRDSACVVSTVPEIAGHRAITPATPPAGLADVEHAVVRAHFGVAETGSLLLSDAALTVNALGYLAQHLVVLLDPADLVADLHHAYARPDFHDHAYAVLHSGPSATADIEGVLIRGAQGVRSLSLAFVPRS